MRAEGENCFPHPADYTAFDIVQGIVQGTNNSLGCKNTLLLHRQSHQSTPPSPPPQGCSQSSLYPDFICAWNFPDHVQGLALGLVKLNKVCTGLTLKPVKVLLDGIPFLQHVDHTTSLGVAGGLAEGALGPCHHQRC